MTFFVAAGAVVALGAQAAMKESNYEQYCQYFGNLGRHFILSLYSLVELDVGFNIAEN